MTIRFCPGESPHWFAFRNEGRDWIRIRASILQTEITFPALERLEIAYGRGLAGSAFSDLTILNVTRDDVDQFRCGIPYGNPAGALRMSGTVQGRDANDYVYLHMGTAFDIVFNGSGHFDLLGLGPGKADLIGIARTDGTAPSDGLLILRRDIDVVNFGAISLVDFNSAEAKPSSSASVTVGDSPFSSLYSAVMFRSANGTVAEIHSLSSAASQAVPIAGVSADQVVAGDRHTVLVSAFASGSGTLQLRDVSYPTNALKDTTVELGPLLSTSDVDTLATDPLVRLRISLPRQPEYASAASTQMVQLADGGFREVLVVVSSAYAGTATDWTIETPDLTGIPDFPTSWMLQRNQPTGIDVRATSGPPATLTGALLPLEGQQTRSAMRNVNNAFTPVGTTLPWRTYRGGRFLPVSTVGR
ncbi:MAG TPA: hypothetical protein VEB19_05720 [Gemmatimonadaceae bacterium]|nr:hypothetical protein [Gemmatimonadaceae bacterium]